MAEELTMGDLVPLRLTRKKILREALREINRMYQLSHGGMTPSPARRPGSCSTWVWWMK